MVAIPFAQLVPFIGDLTVVAGVLREPLRSFFVLVTLRKAVTSLWLPCDYLIGRISPFRRQPSCLFVAKTEGETVSGGLPGFSRLRQARPPQLVHCGYRHTSHVDYSLITMTRDQAQLVINGQLILFISITPCPSNR